MLRMRRAGALALACAVLLAAVVLCSGAKRKEKSGRSRHEKEPGADAQQLNGVLSGKRVLVVESWLKRAPTGLGTVDGLLCEFAFTHNVTMDLLLSGTRAAASHNTGILADPLSHLCYTNVLYTTSPSLAHLTDAAMLEQISATAYDGVVGVVDMYTHTTQALALMKGVAPLLKPTGECSAPGGQCVPREYNFDAGEGEPAEEGVAALLHKCDDTCTQMYSRKWEMESRVTEQRRADKRSKAKPPLSFSEVDLSTCSVQHLDRVQYPAYVKYSSGVFTSGGVGGDCLRLLGTMRSEEELLRKLPVFCHPLMQQGARSQSHARDLKAVVSPFLEGAEVYADVVVFHGEVVHVEYKEARWKCNGIMYETVPPVLPGGVVVGEFEPSAAPHELSRAVTQKCDEVVREVAAGAGAWNLFGGAQLMVDWKDPSGSCRLVELNLRPHATMGKTHDPRSYVSRYPHVFDSGAVVLYLALDVDPSPLITRANPAQHSSILLQCRAPTDGNRGFLATSEYWNHENRCAVTARASPWAMAATPELAKFQCSEDETNLVPLMVSRICSQSLHWGTERDLAYMIDAIMMGRSESEGTSPPLSTFARRSKKMQRQAFKHSEL
eukprot:TRINITY_DN2613_c0_g1_i1.p1 TRINITY_DN2613_c0_g1~~TRINITY_DN2613_c0_g1_i1.p1  ORF type:complete len:621 (+),score=217.22 TRINITY_DN2613_c0_g1_i1:38-1864(+)